MEKPKTTEEAATARIECDALFGELSPSAIKARAVIAGDLFREGRITQPECLRLEVDAVLGEDTGPIRYEKNDDYKEMVADPHYSSNSINRTKNFYDNTGLVPVIS